jgi:hypothetical protein
MDTRCGRYLQPPQHERDDLVGVGEDARVPLDDPVPASGLAIVAE